MPLFRGVDEMSLPAHSCKECMHHHVEWHEDDLDEDGIPSKTHYCTLAGTRRDMRDSETVFGCGKWREQT